MNENPEGTPNPLTTAPEAVAPTPAPTPEASAPVSTEAAPASVPAAPKKKKTGIIIGSIIGLLVLGGGIAAILILFVFNKSGDPASDAFLRLLNNDERNISISGNYTFDFMGAPISADFNAQIDSVAKAGVATADISGSFQGEDASLNLEARLTGNETAYIKANGISKILSSFLSLSSNLYSSNSLFGSSLGSSLGTSLDMSSMFSTLDEQWFRIDNVSLSSMALPGGINIGTIYNHKNEVVDLYKKYPFLTSTTKDLKVAKKNDTIYKLGLDYDKMASFSNEVFSKNCSPDAECGMKGLTASDLQTYMGNIGDIYVEIDGKNNFTRVYIESPNSQTMDFSISYPANVNVVEPDEYVSLNDLAPMFSMFGGFDMNSLLNGLNGGGSSSNSYQYNSDDDDLDIDLNIDDIDLDDFDWAWGDDED